MANDVNYTDQDFKIVGSRPPRPDGLDKVTGRAKYGADAFAPGQLVGRILRSPHAHAKIRKIDISRAEKMKGVKAVITSKDLPDLTNGNRGNFDILENCMARDRALYHGHAVAAVAAVDEPTARKALKAIKVDYKMLPHVTDVDEAMADDAPIVQPHMCARMIKPSNIANMSQFGHGDVDAGFKKRTWSSKRAYRPSRPTRVTSNPTPAWPASVRTVRASCG